MRSFDLSSPLALAAVAIVLLSNLAGVPGFAPTGLADDAPADKTSADKPAADPAKADAATAQTTSAPSSRRPAKDPPGMRRLMPDADVWIDPKNKRVVVDGVVCLREGQLEMFACPRGTKEHESIVAVDAKAHVVHAALLAVGAEPGSPSQFQPSYKPASGTEIEITVIWTDKHGVVHRERAQDWVRNNRTGKTLEYPWVFAGSGFWEDPATGQKSYMAEAGDFICVSNFPTAMLDLPVESSQANEELLFQANTERVPPVGTKVRLVLTPKLKKEG